MDQSLTRSCRTPNSVPTVIRSYTRRIFSRSWDRHTAISCSRCGCRSLLQEKKKFQLKEGGYGGKMSTYLPSRPLEHILSPKEKPVHIKLLWKYTSALPHLCHRLLSKSSSWGLRDDTTVGRELAFQASIPDLTPGILSDPSTNAKSNS